MTTKLANGHYVYQMAVKHSQSPANMPTFAIPLHSKIYQKLGFFGMITELNACWLGQT
jgi:hypothetical protein